jgi:hypothetical protein
MKTTEVSSPLEFHQAMRNHWDKNYVYRGEDSTGYQLLSKFGRDQAKNPKNDLAVETVLLRSFKRSAIPLLSYNAVNDWDWLSIAQHHGLHTRLLDWTWNPLVAAFFAVHGSHFRDTVVHAFDSADLPISDEKTSPYSISDVHIFRPRELTTRVTAQAGLFTVHPSPATIFTVPSLERILIRKACQVELDVVLHTYNIDDNTMFPDLDGLCRSLNRVGLYLV